MKHREPEIELSRKGFVTNYPHFRYWKKEAAAGLLTEPPLNIYIHIPFCPQKCAYCYYKTERYKNPQQLAEFVDALCREIRLAGHRFNLGRRPVQSIYIGGGTPSLLRGKTLQTIADCLRENTNLEAPEFTIEAEPGTITPDKVAAYKDLGVNRMSIGIQSFNDEIVRLSGRKHTADKAQKAIGIVRDAGDIAVNIDLLSGLAGETDETWSATLDTAIASGVHNITIYKMEVYLNTEFFQQSVRRQVIRLPSEARELEFMETALEKFAASPYKPWSFFTFTLNGESRHRYAANLWHGQDCCAFGPSGFGKLGAYNYQNANELEHYLEAVARDELPITRGYRLTGKDMMLRDILLGMKLVSLERCHFYETHGFDFCRLIPDTVDRLLADGFIVLTAEAIRLTPKGVLYGDYVGKRLADALKQYLGPDELNLF
jgi:oxygen-independent coproporphyrinogen-3 oxidase